MSSATAGERDAVSVSLAYYEAWTSKDFDRAMELVADDIVCDAPSGRLQGAAAFREFMEPFSKMLTRAELIAAFGDERTSLLMYDTDTVLVTHAPGAECHIVEDGKITRVTIIFDRQPFTEARAG
jgi:ketosteroid isomerase-like protein